MLHVDINARKLKLILFTSKHLCLQLDIIRYFALIMQMLFVYLGCKVYILLLYCIKYITKVDRNIKCLISWQFIVSRSAFSVGTMTAVEESVTILIWLLAIDFGLTVFNRVNNYNANYINDTNTIIIIQKTERNNWFLP